MAFLLCAVCFLFHGQDHSHGVRVPIHAEAERVAKVAQLEVVVAADGVGGKGKRLAVQVDGGVRERCRLIAGRQGSLLAADRACRRSCSSGRCAAARRSTLTSKLVSRPSSAFGEVAQLEVVAAVDGVRCQALPTAPLSVDLVGGNLCGRVGQACAREAMVFCQRCRARSAPHGRCCKGFPRRSSAAQVHTAW